jgi:hypothetical protein
MPFMSLKVLSIEMDLAKSGVIPWVFFQGRAAEILANFAPHPSCESPLKFASASLFINMQL